MTTAVVLPLVTAAALVMIAITSSHKLPLLIDGGMWTGLNIALNIAGLVLLLVAVVLTLKTRPPLRELFRWLALTFAAVAIGIAFALLGSGRYSVGWYSARASWLVSSVIVLVYFFTQFMRQRRELSRAADELADRTRERDGVWNVSEDLLGVLTIDGYFTGVNPAWQKVLGWSEHEVRSMDVEAMSHPEDGTHSRATRAQLAQGGPTVRMVNRLRHKDGSWRWISWAMSADRGLIYVAGRDVTAEREAEAALRKAETDANHLQRMESLGQLTGGVAHDFNNLLMIMSGYLPRLRKAVPDEPRNRQAIEAIETTISCGISLTRQLLAFSRRQPLNPELVNIADRLQALQPILRSTLAPRIAVAIETAPDLGLVKVDASELELALLNVVINARDAIEGDGEVHIRCHNSTLSAETDGIARQTPCVEIAIADSGRGMTREVIERAFEPFFTTKAVGKGTGLGLSQVHGFVRQSGGDVRIESSLGQGTTIRLLLPAVYEAPAARREKAALQNQSGRALLIEDNADVAVVSRMMLEEIGYSVRTASDAASGLAAAQSEAFDLVVSDIVMPGSMSGIELAETLRQQQPACPVLLVSGYSAMAGSVPKHLVVVGKPFTMEQLSAGIARVRSGGEAHRR